MVWLQFFFPEPDQNQQEILLGLLSEFPFDAFKSTPEGLFAYTPKKVADAEDLFQSVKAAPLLKNFTITEVEEENWNAKWESSFSPVVIEGKVGIRAGFHQPLNVENELIIEPKMSFGTGHHPTTAGVIKLMLEEDWKGKTVLDLGSGTGLLAILARKLGAEQVIGVDNDPWCDENFRENILLNQVKHVKSILGTIQDIPTEPFGMVIANINRNVLLDIMADLASRCIKGGTLILSGFYLKDKELMLQSAEKSGFRLITQQLQNDWLALKFSKE